MKLGKKLFSIVIAALMLLTMMPMQTTKPVQAAGNQYIDPYVDPTDINIPISLDGTSETRGTAMAATLDYSSSNSITWKHPGKYSEFVKLMESTDAEDRYISLTKDISDTWRHQKMDTIHITSFKVLDLNGHSLKFHVDSNARPWSTWGVEQSPYDRDSIEHHMNTAFDIDEGATVHILDSSARQSANGKSGTGMIYIGGYMVDPYEHEINHYANFDLFNVSNGNLLIYGGTFQAGRSKAQFKSNFSWKKLRDTIGQAVEIGVSVANYATGIEAALAAEEDVIEKVNKMSDNTDTSKSKPAKNEKTEQTTKDPDNKPAMKTVGEKQNEIDNATGTKPLNNSENGEQKANEKGSAKQDKDKETGKNSQIAEAHKKVVDSVLNQNQITDIVGKCFDFAEGIFGMIGNDQKSRIVQTHFGTCVRVGNQGTFVAYGGEFNGYGSSPNTRNAVIETTRQGHAYIFGGNFYGRSGANIFNEVKTMGVKKMEQNYKSSTEGQTTQQVTIEACETNNLEQIMYEDDAHTIPVNTSNIIVRGGTFENYYEAKNIAIKGNSDENFQSFAGTAGAVNLGLESYNEDFIRDGRIQINDMYGDGALVIMDENSGTDGSLYHYRLFCSDMELRYKTGLRVYPNTANTNSTYSFSLMTQYNDGDTERITKILDEDTKNENVRGAYSTTEKVFYYPLKSQQSNGYTIRPFFKNLDADGKKIGESPTWYYPNPVTTENKTIEPLILSDSVISGSLNSSATNNYQEINPNIVTNSFNSTLNTTTTTFGGKTYVDSRTVGDTSSKNLNKVFDNYSTFDQKYQYLSNLKWLEYKIYRVDPLTRLNIGKDGTIGDDQPIATAVYGSRAETGLKTVIRLEDLEKKIQEQDKNFAFRQGEIYRVTLSVEERLNCDYNGYNLHRDNTTRSDYDEYYFTNSIGTAKATGSILFMCYGNNERVVKEGYNSATNDYTPLQWLNTPKAGYRAYIDLVNGKTGNVDGDANTRIFDIYYQWWTVDDNGNPDQLIAGTTNIWDIAAKYKDERAKNTIPDQMKKILNTGKQDHSFNNWLRGKDGFQYANTFAPDDPLLEALDENGNKVVYGEDGLPLIEYTNSGQIKTGTNLWPKDTDECSRLLHAYASEWSHVDYLKAFKKYNLSNQNNNQDYGHYDSCYIPKSLAGKKIMVKAIAVNVNWTNYYDAVQTFYSHAMTIGPRTYDEQLEGEVGITYGPKGDYASLYNEATLSLEGVAGLEDDEYIKKVTFKAFHDGFHYTKVYNLNQGDELPTAKFPDDFFDGKYLEKGKKYAKLDAQEYNFNVSYDTNLTRTCNFKSEDGAKPGRLEVEADSVKAIKDSYTFDLADIKSGKFKDGEINLFSVRPLNYSIAPDYSTASSTDADVAIVDSSGKLQFGGYAGTTVLSFTGPDGNTSDITVTVIDYVDDVEIYNIDPPTIGQTLPTGVAIPEDVDYHIKEVYWTDGSGERLAANVTARNYKAYTINVVIERNDASLVFRNADAYSYSNVHPFTLYVNTVDGEGETISNNLAYGRFDYIENPVTGEYEVGETCTFSYTYTSAIGAAPGTIDEVSMDFPTEVAEGESVDEWLEQFLVRTNGDDSEFLFRKGFVFTPFAVQTFKAYGYNVSSLDPTDTMKAFVKGTIEGPKVDIDLDPNGDNVGVQFADADDVDLYINGETGQDVYKIVNRTSGTFVAFNALNVLDGTAIPVLPKYRVKDFNLAVDEDVKLDDLLETEGNIRLICDMSRAELIPGWDWDDPFFEYDEVKNILTGVRISNDELTIPLYIAVDGNGDGVVDMRVNENRSKKIYAKASDCPPVDNGKSVKVNVTVLNPDGSTASSGRITGFKAYSGALTTLDIPTVEGAFIQKIECRGVEDLKYSLSTWGDRVLVDAEDGDSITVYTSDVKDLIVKTSPTEIYPQFEGIGNLCVSLDGDHWTESKNALTNLEPDTEYLLYYRQGVSDTFYTKVVRTNEEGDTYGLYLGRNPITKSNTGILERDHYHYDPETKTLTLKDFRLTDMGIDVASWKFFYQTVRAQAVIFAEDDLTIELIGDNYIEKLGEESSFILGNVVRCNGNIKITGDGSLTIQAQGFDQVFQPGKGKDIDLEGSGKLTVNDAGIIFCTEDGGKTFYTNGELDFNHCISSVLTDNTFVTRTTMHDYTIYGGSDDRVEISGIVLSDSDRTKILNAYTLTEDNADYYYAQQMYQHLVPEHNFTKQEASDRYYVSGDCSTGTTYYKSCADCGAPDYAHTFTVAAGDHALTHHDAQAVTCTEDGWKAYDTCTKCGYTTFEAIPASGHSFVHHEEVAPTCEKDGCPAYDVCSVCGFSTLDKTIQASMESKKRSAGTVERDDMWVALGHDLVFIPEEAAPAGGTGTEGHYKCVHCDHLFADAYATTEVTKADLESLGDPGEYIGPDEPAVQPKLNVTKKTLKAGKTVTLKVTDGTAVSWKSSKAAVASVSTKGVVTAKKKGSATITVLLKDGSKLTCKITVSTSPTLKVGKKAFKAKTTYTVKKGKTLNITITGKASSIKNVYSSSKKKIAKVISKNTATKIKIKGLKKGKATVTVKVNGVAFKIKVKVK